MGYFQSKISRKKVLLFWSMLSKALIQGSLALDTVDYNDIFKFLTAMVPGTSIQWVVLMYWFHEATES